MPTLRKRVAPIWRARENGGRDGSRQVAGGPAAHSGVSPSAVPFSATHAAVESVHRGGPESSRRFAAPARGTDQSAGAASGCPWCHEQSTASSFMCAAHRRQLMREIAGAVLVVASAPALWFVAAMVAA